MKDSSDCTVDKESGRGDLCCQTARDIQGRTATKSTINHKRKGKGE